MLKDLEAFLPKLFLLIAKTGVDVSGFLMDHVCYRVATMRRYEDLKHAWSLYSEKVHTSMVNGRPITVFVFRNPIVIGERIIRVIELPAPKEGAPYPEGWEHAEFVTDEPLENFMSRYDEIEFDRKGMGKKLNSELGLKLGEGLQIKFHEQPLEKVIEIEERMGLGIDPPVGA